MSKFLGSVQDVDPAIHTQFYLYYGLSLFNLQENDKASKVLDDLFKKTKEPRMHLYATFADIRVENNEYQNGRDGNKERLGSLLNRLEKFKELKQYGQQELLIAVLKLESACHLGLSDKAYLERAIEEYDGYAVQTQENETIRYFYALCFELNGDRGKAAEIYGELNWSTDVAIAERYMICLILNDEPKKAISVYEDMGAKTVNAKAVYLFALDRSGAESYILELKKAVEDHRGGLEEFLQIAYFTDSEKPAKTIVIPVLKDLMTEEALSRLHISQKIAIITFLAHCKEIELMERAVASIDDVSNLNNFTISEIYKSLFAVASNEFSLREQNIHKANDLEAADRIADRFLERDDCKKHFLQIKVLCAGAKQMPFSSLKYSKELFKITRDEDLACNIIGLLFNRAITNSEEYAPYLEALKKSEKPNHCMTVASAMLILGREETAEFYAYKALYLLNGKDDYDIFKRYLGFCNFNGHHFYQDALLRSVKSNTVVMLEDSNPIGEPGRIEVCLDSESDFADESNRSMGIEHLSSSNPEYVKLLRSGLNQILNLRGKSYKIVNIMLRGQYGLKYIFQKISKKPEMFKEAIWTITADNPEEMIKQIKELTDNTEKINSLLEAYHFKDNSVGLPIDAVALGDYSRYIAALRYLLCHPDEAFYAGQTIYEDETKQKYIPSLATLVLLAVLRRIDVLEVIKSTIIIPESYIAFFQNEYSKAASLDPANSSTLFFVEDRPVMQGPDETIPEIWEAVVEFCRGCTTCKVDDNERISFKIVDGLTGERLMAVLRLSPIHLDALLLAQRENATFLCDDLFFRRVASWMNLRNVNIASLIQHYDNLDYMVPFILELSKTNYIYIPLRARSDEEAHKLYKNVLTGEKKRKYYTEFLNRFFEVRDRVLREFFGNDFVDRLRSGAKDDGGGPPNDA